MIINFKQESPKRKAPTKNNANNKNTPQRSKRAAAAATKTLKEESSGENESEDDEPLSKKAKPSPPTVNCPLHFFWYRKIVEHFY